MSQFERRSRLPSPLPCLTLQPAWLSDPLAGIQLTNWPTCCVAADGVSAYTSTSVDIWSTTRTDNIAFF